MLYTTIDVYIYIYTLYVSIYDHTFQDVMQLTGLAHVGFEHAPFRKRLLLFVRADMT